MVKYGWANRMGELLIICVPHFSCSEYHGFLDSYIFPHVCSLTDVIPHMGAEPPTPVHDSRVGAEWAGRRGLAATCIMWGLHRGCCPLTTLQVSVHWVSSKIKAHANMPAGSELLLLLSVHFTAVDFWFSGVFGLSWTEQGSEGSIKSSGGENKILKYLFST